MERLKAKILDITNKLNMLQEDIKEAVTMFKGLAPAEYKAILPYVKDMFNAAIGCVKAAGYKWWHEWGHFVGGWIIFGIGIALPWALGWLKILFEH